MSTWLPGRKATAPLRSTVKPPLTRPKITPVTRSFAWKLFSSRVQASSRRAFSRDSCGFAVLVLHPFEVDLDGVADMEVGLAAAGSEFLERDAALRI